MVITPPPPPALPPSVATSRSSPWPDTSRSPSTARHETAPAGHLSVERTQATVAVGLERAHAECRGQSQSLTVGGFGQFGLRGLAVRVDLAEESQGPGLLTLLRLRAADLQATHSWCQCLVEAAEAEVRLRRPGLEPPPACTPS